MSTLCAVLPNVRPMPLVRIPQPFDSRDWIFELKHDGFRALAHIDGHRCRLVSRRGHLFAKFNLLAEEIAHSVRGDCAIIDGEIVCLGCDGRSEFYPLLFRREWPPFVAFDALRINGEDLTGCTLLERKRQLRAIMPRVDSRLLYLDHVRTRGVRAVPCGLPAGSRRHRREVTPGRYSTDGVTISWLKITNPEYSQMAGRRELFERRSNQRRTRGRSPCCVLNS